MEWEWEWVKNNKKNENEEKLNVVHPTTELKE